jgi:hypothetical protein
LVEVSRLKKSAAVDKTVLGHELVDEIKMGHGELMTRIVGCSVETQGWMFLTVH